jgi:phage shock protein A
MSIFTRMSDIVVANIHTLLDRAEDPVALLAQVNREMEAGLAEARRSAAMAVAAERRLERERDQHRTAAEYWKARAKEALASGREDLARRALSEKVDHDAVAAGLDELLADAATTGLSARAALRTLEARLAEARRAERTLVARHRTAQIRVAVHRQLGPKLTGFTASLARFDRLGDQLTRRSDELSAEAELSVPAKLDAEFADLERRQRIETELAAISESDERARSQ